MEKEPSALLGWLPLMMILVVYALIVWRSVGRQRAMMEVAKANTEAVRENTEVLRAMLAKLEERETL